MASGENGAVTCLLTRVETRDLGSTSLARDAFTSSYSHGQAQGVCKLAGLLGINNKTLGPLQINLGR
jgi:hypothetical protein